MGKIVAIGGGEIGRPGYPVETTAIDKEIIKLSGKKSPKLLFLPTASGDSRSYVEVVKKHFGKTLGCKVEPLYLIGQKTDFKKLREKILGSDIIYVGGGNTLAMLERWKETGVDKILREAYEKGIVLSGLSAGAICWFKYGHSDSLKFTTPERKKWDHIVVKGLGLVKGLVSPHFVKSSRRGKHIAKIVESTGESIITIGDCAAIEIVDGKFRIITSKPRTKVFKIYWNKKLFIKEINNKKDYQSLEKLAEIKI